MNNPQVLKKLLNDIRNLWMFKIRYPWVIIGSDIHCQLSTSFWSPHKNVVLGDHIGIGSRCVFLSDVEIGSKVLIAAEVALINCDDHRCDIVGKTIWDSGRNDQHKIIIEDDVWIGHGSIILTPTCVGRGSIVAAGSVVTKNVPRYSIVAGVPAKVVKMRFTEEQIAEHEMLLSQEKTTH